MSYGGDIEELNLSNRVANCLYGPRYDYPEWAPKYKNLYPIRTISDLIHHGVEKLRKIPGIGQLAIDEILFKLKEYSKIYVTNFNEDIFLKNKKHATKQEFISSKPDKVKSGYIYAIQASDIFTKLGHSIHFPTKRLEEISTACPYLCELKGFIKTEDRYSLERKIHAVFKSYRHNREWFKIDYKNIKNLSEFVWEDYSNKTKPL